MSGHRAYRTAVHRGRTLGEGEESAGHGKVGRAVFVVPLHAGCGLRPVRVGLRLPGGHGLLAPEPWALPRLDVGTNLCGACGTALFKVTGRAWLPPVAAESLHAVNAFLLTALVDLPEGPLELTPRKEGLSLAWVTLSDRGAQFLRFVRQ